MNTASGQLFQDAFDTLPLMAILRGFDVARTVEVSRRAWDVGIRLVEVPIQSRTAEAALRAAVEAGEERGAVVGAGTVTTVERVERAVEAGARFTVAPGFSREVAEASLVAGLPHLPGVATASEIQQAEALGLTWLKAFPAADLGPGWITSMHGPFPEARFVATGGVNLANAVEFLDAGAAAVSLGSALADPDQFARLPELIEAITGKVER
ncbi:bifunctional 4-hydroxy-2-oxoglutarate aldolase/2-dehydro-3-deoxy-phosphogluconate aldolase [Streptomyces sp. KM273126]|uniref:bifunctional 4-hydroxy-2-oxoglutarate aldolase/2-dehydro-3-deoxy-phosphogluconate aldolase n=1 Tax=Streptomyces sp. KM273126 TaxID=2545247 RepID=UPI00103D8DAA|nr:bifunctional 4-hydroxy-2-oxoglutarate aldolase/2-dehydro-3-deoxy-phosphogluconate aldolase [Streptomyces sp. KM273126]MBA2810570.1 bifunctional 4-hydroxy-2-oxoglutarate aldolase/2-dehydro-3-deoxy-phosphogluconate aldolase [Streptomyces sp. KM273126]